MHDETERKQRRAVEVPARYRTKRVLRCACPTVEHYEMSRYGTLRTWALELGLTDAAGLLQTTLDEEQATDLALTSIATSVVNQNAE